MKAALIGLLFITCFLPVLHAQSVNVQKIDTFGYLRTIVAHKANYIGKPFSTLLNDLQIQIKRFAPIGSIPSDTTRETSTSFSFYFPQSAAEYELTFPKLNISWEPYLNATASRYLFRKNNGGGWTQEVINFYSTAIIKDMDIL
jgi:hypothetical protein